MLPDALDDIDTLGVELDVMDKVNSLDVTDATVEH